MNHKKPNGEQYLDLKGLSEYSSIPVRTLREYLSDVDNPIPAFRLQRKILVRVGEFDRWMEGYRLDNTKLDRMVDELLDGIA